MRYLVKKFLVLFLIVHVFSTNRAQEDIFLRVYDSKSKKLAKGFYAGGSDSNIYIFKNKDSYPLAIRNIGYIKTRRTMIRRVVVTTLGIGIVSVLFLVSLGNRPFIPLDLPKRDPRRKRIKTDERLKKKLIIAGDHGNWIIVKQIIDHVPLVQ